MAVLGLAFVASLIVWWAVYKTRQQIAFAQTEDDGSDVRGFVVAVDETSGKFRAVTGDLEAMRRTWHPVRFPHSWESRAAGLPAEKSYSDAGFAGRRAWCEKRCKGAWRLEDRTIHGLVVWFEDAQDATEFALAWFPFKCG